MNLDEAKTLLLESITNPNTYRAYRISIEQFETWLHGKNLPFNRATIQAYKRHLVSEELSASTVSLRLCALRRMTVEAADAGFIEEKEASKVTRVRGLKREAVRLGNWLTPTEAQQFVLLPDTSTMKGKRDRALFAVMIGTGLRREETSSLMIDQIQMRDGRWIIVDLKGKGGRVRSVPMPGWAKQMVDEWLSAARINTGRVFRGLSNAGTIDSPMLAAQSIYEIVAVYAGKMGKAGLAPHDLRRTFSKLAHTGGAPVEQIQYSLGHASQVTTARYLGIHQNLTDAPADRLGLTF